LTNQVWEGTIIFFLSGIIGGLIGQLGGKPSWNLRRVHIVEDVEWSLFNALRAARIGVVGGVFLGLATIASFHFTGWEGLTAGSGLTLTSLLIVVIRWLLSSLVSGAVMTRERDLDEKSQPNEGIWLSLRHAFQALLIDGGAAALAFGVTASFIINQDPLLAGKNPFLVGLISFLLFGRVGFLLYGGYACLSHVALRFVLWYYGHMPWDYAKFLDSCVKSGFLQQIHNHYEFVHLLLLEYIATLDE
jgi:hypothetical protein